MKKKLSHYSLFPIHNTFFSGFSVIELIVVISLIAILGTATAIPFASQFFNRNNLENKTNELVSSLWTAKINSISGKENSPWGVHTETGKIVMFKGTSYTPPGTSFDQIYIVPNTVSVTQIDVIFNVLSGNPNTTQSIVVQNGIGESHTIGVNEVGTVTVN